MSTFTDTKPAGAVQYYTGIFCAAFAVYAVSFSGYQFLIRNRAATAATHEITELHETTMKKLVADAKKKLPKGEKADEKKLEASAHERFTTDAKVKESYEKGVAEIRHHAEGGLFPLSCFFAVASALLGGIFASILLVKRNKASGLCSWLAFFSHIPSYATFAFIAFLPILGHLAHHEDVSLVEFIKANGPVTLGAVVAGVGAVVLLVAGVLPERKGHDDDHGHGEACGCSH